MTARLHGLHPFVVDGHCLFQFARSLGSLFPTEKTRLAGGRQMIEHQLLLVLLLLLIELAHIVETGIVAQFSIYIIIGLIIGAEHHLVETVS